MIEYIYFVKCPNCEDEHFDFFDEAKAFALGCLTKKPIITQIEVNRNDFGECVDSCDLGTVWSWEEVMKDTEPESEGTILSKAETFGISDIDKEFDDFDIKHQSDEFSDDCLDLVPESDPDDSEDAVSESLLMPNLPGLPMIEELVEMMEENEDNYECYYCGETVPKDQIVTEFDNASKKDIHVCPECHDQLFGEDSVECGWCHERFDKSECRYEVDLGWLCDGCEMAIKSRGETLTFREGPELLDEDYTPEKIIEFEYTLTAKVVANQRDADDWDEADYTADYTYKLAADEVAVDIWEHFITEEDVKDVEGGLEALEDDAAWEEFLKSHFDTLLNKYYEQLKVLYKDTAQADFESNLEYVEESCAREKTISEEIAADETSEISEISKSHLTLCPECGQDAFDIETGICINCGFN